MDLDEVTGSMIPKMYTHNQNDCRLWGKLKKLEKLLYDESDQAEPNASTIASLQ